VEIAANLLSGTQLEFGGDNVEITRGVPQGGVLSPLMFNVVLEEILLSNPRLKRAIDEGNLLAFADDIFVSASSHE